MSERSNEIKKTNNPAPKNWVDRFYDNKRNTSLEGRTENWSRWGKRRELRQIVNDMWYDWNKVRVDLAVWAWIKKSEYKWTMEQNETIRKKILSGEKFNSNLDQSISKFSVEKQDKIKQIVWTWEFTVDRVDSYISSLPPNQTEILEKLPNEKFVWFLHQEMEYSKKISDKLVRVYWPEVQSATKEQLANIIVLSNIDEKLKRYLSENKQFEKHYEEASQKVESEFLRTERKELELKVRKDEIRQLRIVSKTEEARKKLKEKQEQLEKDIEVFQKDENVILLNEYGWSYEAAIKHMTINLATRNIVESEEYENLDASKKKEFDAILVDVYRHNEKVSPQLNEIYFPDMKIEIEQKEREINQVNLNMSKSFADSQKTVLENKEFNNYFQDNYINEFVSEEQKDQAYRDNLQKLYPNSKNIIQDSFAWMPDYQSCFDDAGNINKNELAKLPKDKQDIFNAEIKEKLKFVDEELVSNINSAVKEQSVETCLATLSKCMNIKFDDGTKEDLIKNFDFASHMNDNLVVDFNGTLNGKKINLSYNMVDGKVYYQEYLYKDKWTNTFKKSDPNVQTEMLFVELPKLEDFISASKSLDYAGEMWEANNIDDFHSSIKDRLNSQVQKNIDIKDARENFEKSMLQDIAMQESFTLMWYGENKNLSNIDKKEEPNLYKLYSMLYDSISFYSVDELKSFRECIKLLNIQKSKISENYNNLSTSKDMLNKYSENNQEKFFFDLSMNNAISRTYSKKESEKNNYLWFFECFIKNETKPMSVLDLSKMQDYISKLWKEVTSDSDNVLQRQRNDVFKKNLWRIRDSYDVLAMEKSF